MDFFLAWYNLLFILSLFTGVLLIFASMMGGGDEVGADADVDADVDVDVDVDVDHDHDMGHDSGHGHHGWYATVLSGIGVGKVKFSLLISMLFLSFGVIGMCVNHALRSLIGVSDIFALVSVAVAVFGALLVSGRIASLIHRYMPMNETNVVTRYALCGQTGTVSIAMSDTVGFANVRDKDGTMHEAKFHLIEGKVEKGVEVLIVEYDSKNDVYNASILEQG